MHFGVIHDGSRISVGRPQTGLSPSFAGADTFLLIRGVVLNWLDSFFMLSTLRSSSWFNKTISSQNRTRTFSGPGVEPRVSDLACRKGWIHWRGCGTRRGYGALGLAFTRLTIGLSLLAMSVLASQPVRTSVSAFFLAT